jgi:hypothetical protein
MAYIQYKSYQDFNDETGNMFYYKNAGILKGSVEIYLDDFSFDLLHTSAIASFDVEDIRIDLKGLKGAGQLTTFYINENKIKHIKYVSDIPQIGIWLDNDSYVVFEIN